jgi:hypothetical protein
MGVLWADATRQAFAARETRDVARLRAVEQGYRRLAIRVVHRATGRCEDSLAEFNHAIELNLDDAWAIHEREET